MNRKDIITAATELLHRFTEWQLVIPKDAREELDQLCAKLQAAIADDRQRFLREGCEISQALRQESRSTPTKGVLLMQNEVPSIQSSRYPNRPKPDGATRIALDENELAIRWGLSVKTLRRWRQEQLGPVFCKLGARVTYLISEIEAFERRVSRHSTFTRVYQ